MKKKALLALALAALVAGGTFAQRTAGKRYEPNPVSDFKFTASSSSVTITGYQGTENRVVIPTEIGGKPVTAIGANAFKDNTLITELVIFDGITSIGNNAFLNSSLRWININECTTIGSIGNGAFQGTDIQDMISSWPAGKVKKIPNNAFRDSDLNKALVIPDGVTEIGDHAFAGTQITSVILPISVTKIGANAFRDCKQLTTVTIPNSSSGGLTEIGNYAFAGTQLKSIAFPQSINRIGGSAFSDCGSLTTVTIPSSVTKITFGSNPFYLTVLNATSKKALTDRGARL